MAAGTQISAASKATAPRRRNKEATKQALLTAAEQVFSERGYDAATTREVAQRAGVNEQLIQRYFGGKEGLLLTVIRRFGEVDKKCCGAPEPGASVAEEIFNFLKFQMKHAATVGDMSKVALQRSLCDAGMARELGRQFAVSRVPPLRQRLEALRARGLIADDADLDSAATTLSSLSFGLAFVDQLVFGASCEKLERLAWHVAGIYAAGLAPQGTRRS